MEPGELAAPTRPFIGWLLLQAALAFCYEALPEELVFRDAFDSA